MVLASPRMKLSSTKQIQNYDQMKIIFVLARILGGVDSLQLALSHLMDNEAECASNIVITPYERKHWFTSFLRKHYL